MAGDNGKTAYIGVEREEKSLKYTAKVFDKPPFQISKMQYNAIVKALGNVDWRNSDEDEASVISKIISSNLETNNLDES